MLGKLPSSTFIFEIYAYYIYIYISPGIFLLMRNSLFSLEMFCLEKKRWKERHDKCFQILRGLPCGKRRWVCSRPFQKAALGTEGGGGREVYFSCSGVTGFLLWRHSPNLPVFKQRNLLCGDTSLIGQPQSSRPLRLLDPKVTFQVISREGRCYGLNCVPSRRMLMP